MYKQILRPLLFSLPPETAHNVSFSIMESMTWSVPYLPRVFHYQNECLQQTVWGLPFHNPIGLAGGFDKNARCCEWWDYFGFSFAEIGTVTPHPQMGNPKPRLFRYPDEQALVNRMGFNNEGSEKIRARLEHSSSSTYKKTGLLGASIGKQKETPADDLNAVIHDYTVSLEALYPFADYIAVNVSSPNTKDLRSLQERNSLEALLRALLQRLEQFAGQEQKPKRKPLCVKVAPDLSDAQIEDVVDVVLTNRIDGIIAANTTNQTADRESGGLSGKPLQQRSTHIIRMIAHLTNGKVPIVGCGGIFSAQDALEKLYAGAWLLQVYTGFVYEGPAMVYRLNRDIASFMREHQLETLSDLRKSAPVNQ